MATIDDHNNKVIQYTTTKYHMVKTKNCILKKKPNRKPNGSHISITAHIYITYCICFTTKLTACRPCKKIRPVNSLYHYLLKVRWEMQKLCASLTAC